MTYEFQTQYNAMCRIYNQRFKIKEFKIKEFKIKEKFLKYPRKDYLNHVNRPEI